MRSLNQIIYLRPSSLKFIQQHYELKVDFIFRLQKEIIASYGSSGELDFVLENKTKSQKVRVIVLTLANGETEFLTETLEQSLCVKVAYRRVL